MQTKDKFSVGGLNQKKAGLNLPLDTLGGKKARKDYSVFNFSCQVKNLLVLPIHIQHLVNYGFSL